MSPEDQINAVYSLVQHALPSRMVENLKFFNPNDLPKHAGNGVRGRILSATPNGIWNPKWCFYEVGIGHYSTPTFQKLNVGAIGFVSFSRKKECGGGKHLRFLSAFIKSLAQGDGKFRPSDPLNSFQAVFSYYATSVFPSFPVDQAAADVAVLISTTFDDLEKLRR